VGALVEMDWWARTIALDLKLVSVKLVGFGRALPTLSLGFLKSFFLSFFFFALEPMVRYGGQSLGLCVMTMKVARLRICDISKIGEMALHG